MYRHSVLLVLLAAVTCLTIGDDNLQAWSEEVEEGVTHVLTCTPTDTDREPQVTATSTKTWFKHGRAGEITNGSDVTSGNSSSRLEITGDDELVISTVNDASAGIYFCKVSNATDELGTIVKGVNVNGPKKSGIDKYRDNVITAVITGLSVLFIVCGGCLLDHFRYRSPEEKLFHQIGERKQNRPKRPASSGADNPGMEAEAEVAGAPQQEDTHL